MNSTLHRGKKVCQCCSQCPCPEQEFQKIVDLQESGIVIYRYCPRVKPVSRVKGHDGSKKDTALLREVFIVYNTRDAEVKHADFMPDYEKNKSACCNRCSNARKYLDTIPVIKNNEVKGICDMCRIKRKGHDPCARCQAILQKFLQHKREESKQNGDANQVSKILKKIHDSLRYMHYEKAVKDDRIEKFAKHYISDARLDTIYETPYEYMRDIRFPCRIRSRSEPSDSRMYLKQRIMEEGDDSKQTLLKAFSEETLRETSLVNKRDLFEVSDIFSDVNMLTTALRDELPKVFRYFFPPKPKDKTSVGIVDSSELANKLLLKQMHERTQQEKFNLTVELERLKKKIELEKDPKNVEAMKELLKTLEQDILRKTIALEQDSQQKLKLEHMLNMQELENLRLKIASEKNPQKLRELQKLFQEQEQMIQEVEMLKKLLLVERDPKKRQELEEQIQINEYKALEKKIEYEKDPRRTEELAGELRKREVEILRKEIAKEQDPRKRQALETQLQQQQRDIQATQSLKTKIANEKDPRKRKELEKELEEKQRDIQIRETLEKKIKAERDPQKRQEMQNQLQQTRREMNELETLRGEIAKEKNPKKKLELERKLQQKQQQQYNSQKEDTLKKLIAEEKDPKKRTQLEKELKDGQRERAEQETFKDKITTEKDPKKKKALENQLQQMQRLETLKKNATEEKDPQKRKQLEKELKEEQIETKKQDALKKKIENEKDPQKKNKLEMELKNNQKAKQEIENLKTKIANEKDPQKRNELEKKLEAEERINKETDTFKKYVASEKEPKKKKEFQEQATKQKQKLDKSDQEQETKKVKEVTKPAPATKDAKSVEMKEKTAKGLEEDKTDVKKGVPGPVTRQDKAELLKNVEREKEALDTSKEANVEREIKALDTSKEAGRTKELTVPVTKEPEETKYKIKPPTKDVAVGVSKKDEAVQIKPAEEIPLTNKVVQRQEQLMLKHIDQINAQIAKNTKLKEQLEKDHEKTLKDAQKLIAKPSDRKKGILLDSEENLKQRMAEAEYKLQNQNVLKIEPTLTVRRQVPDEGVKVKDIKFPFPKEEDLIFKLIKIKKEDDVKLGRLKIAEHFNLPPLPETLDRILKKKGEKITIDHTDSDIELDKESLLNIPHRKIQEEMIVGQFIEKKPANIAEATDDAVLFFKTQFMPPSEDNLEADNKEPEQIPSKTPGIIRYALSDHTFIENGWTELPLQKVVRKINVYRMRPARPEFDWFEHNKHKRCMAYDTGQKLAEFDDDGRGRWYYRNGRVALDYYDTEELNAQQRYVIHSSGDLDSQGRSHPITVLAMFDFLGNGVVFDHAGKIRLKYTQTEGVVLDREIGPVSRWKWHTLNDPPKLQQVMMDTYMPVKDPRIMEIGDPNDSKQRPVDEEMLAIEYNNFMKERKKEQKKFKPFQIKMKALKINDQFSLRILDQATVYLLFRDGTTSMKLNLGMVLDTAEVIDTDTADVEDVASSGVDKMPAPSQSLAKIQQTLLNARLEERVQLERQRRRLRQPKPCSADRLTAALSRPLRPPLRTDSINVFKLRKPPAVNVYYDSRLV